MGGSPRARTHTAPTQTGSHTHRVTHTHWLTHTSLHTHTGALPTVFTPEQFSGSHSCHPSPTPMTQFLGRRAHHACGTWSAPPSQPQSPVSHSVLLIQPLHKAGPLPGLSWAAGRGEGGGGRLGEKSRVLWAQPHRVGEKAPQTLVFPCPRRPSRCLRQKPQCRVPLPHPRATAARRWI